MRLTRWLLPAALGLAGVSSACGGTGGAPGGSAARAPLVLAAGMAALAPSPGAAGAPTPGLDRLGLEAVDAVYELTTPAGAPFAFDALTLDPGNAGAVRLSLAHLADAGVPPVGGVETLAAVGVAPSGRGLAGRPPWLDAFGDGFSVLGLRGALDRDQDLVLEAETAAGRARALVRLRIGPPSAINATATPGPAYPGVLLDTTLYSSDSAAFGQPAAAVSGDRTTVVVYEGDRSDPFGWQRYELRLQHDRLTGAVTGGASLEPSPDSGTWRDHELAALHNVLALVHGGTDAATLRLSFDRGATFGQSAVLDVGAPGAAARLVQVALAADYGLAALCWRRGAGGASELILVEGSPSAFDASGSPTRFTLEPARVLARPGGDVTPLLLGAQWSDGGDLVVGYGFSSFGPGPDGTWIADTQYRCAVRRLGAAFTDALVERDLLVGRDPSVALLGAGAGLSIWYAYEAADGIRLAVSHDAGATFGPPEVFGGPGASMPQVFVRPRGAARRLDVLYLASAEGGTELRLRHADDHGLTPASDHRLTQAQSTPLPGGGGGPGAGPGGAPGLLPGVAFRVRQIGWFGYDAVRDGDELVVVLDEETYDVYALCLGVPTLAGAEAGGAAGAVPVAGGFVPADPPPLAPGLTEPLPAPDPAHRHQLRLLRLD